ncbi:MAG: TatD family hydrolase, partial [Veillonellaceae bacterium]|nr:TatD family hydrolase [Veillonellaceae bacterium]
MMQLVDTHAHIGTDKFDDDRQDTVARAEDAGVVRIVEMGDSMESSAKAVSIADEFSGVYAAVGIHPEELAPFGEKEASQIE